MTMRKYKIIKGDALEVLSNASNKSIDMAVTSPPYWGLRDYGVEGQLGLEDSPQEYVNNLCDIFDKLKRVLKDDGTFWLNLGDTYNAGRTGGHAGGDSTDIQNVDDRYIERSGTNAPDLKPKDLVGIPWRVALEMQSRGWYLRNDIIWHKQSTMPESVKDRCTTSHEHIFLFSKNKSYYFDQDSIREPHSCDWIGRDRVKDPKLNPDRNDNGKMPTTGDQRGKNKRDVWTVNPASFPDAHFAVYPQELIKPCIKAGCPDDGIALDPFFGAGTTGVVAKRLDRKFCGIELNEKYIEITEERLEDYEWGEGFPNERELPDKAKFLTSVDGIGKKTALDIWDHFDGNVYNIINSDLTQVEGIGDKTYQSFLSEIKSNSEDQNNG